MLNITILVDNTVATPLPKGLRGEWGFAAAINDLLFDTGLSDTAAHNARLLDVPTWFDTIVLSHSHLDHTTGLVHFLDPMNKPTVYLHPDVWTERYLTETPGGDSFPDPVHVGIPYSKAVIESGAEFVEHREPVEIVADVYAVGEIPRQHVEPTVCKVERDGELVADPIRDDPAIAVRTGRGTALILGCCHSGLRNSIEYAEEGTGEEVRYVIGGTHLIALDVGEIHELADGLEGKLELFAGTLCTRYETQAVLAERLPGRFVPRASEARSNSHP